MQASGIYWWTDYNPCTQEITETVATEEQIMHWIFWSLSATSNAREQRNTSLCLVLSEALLDEVTCDLHFKRGIRSSQMEEGVAWRKACTVVTLLSCLHLTNWINSPSVVITTQARTVEPVFLSSHQLGCMLTTHHIYS